MSASMLSIPVQWISAHAKHSFRASRSTYLDADFEDGESESPTSASIASSRDASLSPSMCPVTVLSTSATLPQDHDSKLRCVSDGSDASTEPGSSSEAESCDTCGKKATATEAEVQSHVKDDLDATSYKSPPWAKKPSAPKALTKVGLVSSPTSWVALQQQRRLHANSDANHHLTEDEFGRKIRGILNKLTLERFEALYDQLASSGIASPKHVTVLVREIFEKAITQHDFIPMYGDLCKRLEADDRIIAIEATSDTTNFFRRVLLNQCQTSFENMLAGSSKLDSNVQNDEEAEEARLRSKARTLGNMNFIGRLLVQGMLASKLLITLANELLRKYSVCPDALECLSTLLTVTGRTFDGDATWQHHALLAEIFGQIETVMKDRALPSRIRFLLRDVLDLRAAGWKDRRVATNQKANPMKLDDCRGAKREHPHSTPPWRRQSTSGDIAIPPRKSELGNSPKAGCAVAANLRNRGVQNRSVPASPAPDSLHGLNCKMRRLQKRKLERGDAAPVPSSSPSATDSTPIAVVEVLPTAVLPPPCGQISFSLANFHKELWSAMQTLKRDCDVAKAVERIKTCGVPPKHQATEFADFLARASDEPNASARKAFLQLAAHLGAPDSGAFGTNECLAGVKLFFNEIVSGLCEEDPQLRTVVKLELLPALRTTLPEVQLCLAVAHQVWLLE